MKSLVFTPVLAAAFTLSLTVTAFATPVRAPASSTSVSTQSVTMNVAPDCKITTPPGDMNFGNVDIVQGNIDTAAPVTTLTMSCNAGTQWAVNLDTSSATTATYATASKGNNVKGNMVGTTHGFSYPFGAWVSSGATGTAVHSSTPNSVQLTCGLFPPKDPPVDSYSGQLYVTVFYQ